MTQPAARLEQLWLQLEADELGLAEVDELIALLRQDPALRQALVR